VLDTSPCQFFAAGTRRCVLHQALGPEFKPPSCRHFPKVALLDARGVSLTLSHFCPTAASQLFRDAVPLAVVENVSSVAPEDEYEGLDARQVLPPLLRPGMLWDLDGYSAFEEQAVEWLGRSRLSPELTLAHLRSVCELVEMWRPGADTLRRHVTECFHARREAADSPHADDAHGASGVINRYLAARLFASWVPYRASRLAALVDDLLRTLAMLREEMSRADLLEAIRATDFAIIHTVR
jgi:hypothetical protein